MNVIALISGGKDSFFSILHCLQNGHKVVALGNLHPPEPKSLLKEPDGESEQDQDQDEQDLNSFMYQTVGHTVIPLYEEALGIPLYRQAIRGSARQTGASYDSSRVHHANPASDMGGEDEDDETESLIPLLKRIMAAHPTANALSTGAILSTYQRTRVESVAVRLGLVPLAYLWKYPVLPPGTQDSLLYDMNAVGLDARIVKVASGGLDESALWENVASTRGITRLGRAVSRFGSGNDGAVLGEGGEFETLVIDGPPSLFKGRIEANERTEVREGGGSVWLKIGNAAVIMKPSIETESSPRCRIPDQFDERFISAQKALEDGALIPKKSKSWEAQHSGVAWTDYQKSKLEDPEQTFKPFYLTVGGPRARSLQSITEEAQELTSQIKQKLHESSLEVPDIISTVIILRSMQDFASVNKVCFARRS